MAVLTVGNGKQYKTIPAAIQAAQSGDTIKVDAGTYTNQYAQITKDLTLTGVGGMAKMVSTGLIPNGKAIFIINNGATNSNVTINNFEFSGAEVADHNGAGIRHQGGNLVLNNSYFHDNQEGLLGGDHGTLTINNSEFAHNGYGDSQTHNLYVGKIANLTVNNSYFHEVKGEGHEIKSRALNAVIKNSRIYDLNATASYSIDLPNGGNALIHNNVIEQGVRSSNSTIISYGENKAGLNPGTNFLISNNTILNHKSGHPLAVYNKTAVTAQITNNEFFGLSSSQISSGRNTQTGNQFLTKNLLLNTTHPWSDAAIPPETQSLSTEIPPDLSIHLASDTGSSATDHITANPTLEGNGEPNLLLTVREGSTILGTTMTDDTGAWKFTPSRLAKGAHTLTATQTDPAGNTGSAMLTFRLDSNLDATGLTGTNGNDVLTGTLPGLNVIYGLGGNDTISVKDGHATTKIYGGEGNDIILGSLWNSDYIDGGSGNDILNGRWGTDTILGGDGSDRINGNYGNDIIYAGTGSDTVQGGYGKDIIYTGAGNDTVQGGYGNDTIYVGPGNNQINGGPGTDTAIFAGNYADSSLSSANGVMTVAGGEGTSTLSHIERIQFQDGSYNVLTGSFLR